MQQDEFLLIFSFNELQFNMKLTESTHFVSYLACPYILVKCENPETCNVFIATQQMRIN